MTALDSVAFALARMRAFEDAWNLQDLDKVVASNAVGSHWRCRTDFLWGREQIREFLARKWRRELDYRLALELWAVQGLRCALRFAGEYRDDSGTWYRAYGNEDWECDEAGLVLRRLTSVNVHPISEHERMLRWDTGVRPPTQPGLSELTY